MRTEVHTSGLRRRRWAAVSGAATTMLVVVAVARGATWVSRIGDPPPDPWVRLAEVELYTEHAAEVVVQPFGVPGLEDQVVVVLSEPPRVLVRRSDEFVRYCERSGLLEAADGTWRPTGRGLAGTPSLTEHPATVHDGVLFVDPTATLPVPAPDPAPVEQACGPPDPA